MTIRKTLLFCLATISVTYAAYGGTGTVPYSFEVLPSGDIVMGFARPSCFGWEPSTGNPSSNDAVFNQVSGRPDGFIRDGPAPQAPFVPQTPPTSICAGAASCGVGQWVGGFSRAADGTMAMICCTHGLLSSSTPQGVAALHPGEIFTGGERPGSMFNYISNVRPIAGENGAVASYDVEVAQFSCPEPIPAAAAVAAAAQQAVPQQIAAPAVQAVAPASQYYYPVPQTGAGGGMWCFAADSKVQTNKGQKRMDELKVGDNILVPHKNFDETYYLPVTGWLHRVVDEEAEFVVVTTESGKELKLTDKHLIYKASCNSTILDSSLITADLLKVDDCLYEQDSSDVALQPVKISKVGKVTQNGIYAPLVDLGKLMVDGIAASCYAESSESTLVQTMKDHVVTCNDDSSLQCMVKNVRASWLLELMQLAVPAIKNLM